MKTAKAEANQKKAAKTVKPSAPESPPKPKAKGSPSRSPGRGRKASPEPAAKASAVRGRTRKSPSRKSPSRKSPPRKSPARKSPARKSPARKSPSRYADYVELPPKSPSRRPDIKSTKINDVFKPDLISKTVKEYSLKYTTIDNLDTQNGFGKTREKNILAAAEENFGLVRRSTRIKDSHFDKLLNLAQSTQLPKADYSFENFSGGEDLSEDDAPLKKRKSTGRELATPLREPGLSKTVPSEFGGQIGVILQMIFAPLFVVGINLCCNKNQCSFSLPNLKPYSKLETWLSVRGAAIFASYILIQYVIALIPYFGKRVTVPGSSRTFTANALFSAFITLAVALTLEYLNIPVFAFIFQEFLPILEVSIIYGLLFGFVLFYRGRKATEQKNPFGNTGKRIYDFWMGREINPHFARLDIKSVFMRSALIACLLINFTSLYQGIVVKDFPRALTFSNFTESETYVKIISSVSLSPTLLVFASMQIIYFLHAIISEEKLVHTFEFQREGCGLMLSLGYAVYPFSTPLIPKYILEHRVVLPNWALLATLALYLVGYYIYFVSNAQKNAFRQNPLDPKVTHLESLPTFQGNRLLISGWWGFVRHPNYLGDIILHSAWAMATLQAPPVLFILATVFLLAHRARRDGERCRQRYGVAWERYCTRVPRNLIPRVY